MLMMAVVAYAHGHRFVGGGGGIGARMSPCACLNFNRYMKSFVRNVALSARDVRAWLFVFHAHENTQKYSRIPLH